MSALLTPEVVAEARTRLAIRYANARLANVQGLACQCGAYLGIECDKHRRIVVLRIILAGLAAQLARVAPVDGAQFELAARISPAEGAQP